MLSDDQVKQYVSANVRAVLAVNSWNQSDLAKATGENEVRISDVCRGISVPGAGFLCRLAEALGITADDLMSDPRKKSRLIARSGVDAA